MITIEHDGHKIEVHDFRIRWTYEGFLAGTKAKMSNMIRGELLETLQRDMLRAGTPVIVDNSRPELPEYLCMAILVGDAPQNALDADFGELFLCWFNNDPAKPIRDMVTTALSGVDWDKHAEPCQY